MAEKTKVSITLTEDQERKLQDLANRLGATKSEAVRQALSLLIAVSRHTKGDVTLEIHDHSDGSTREIITSI